MNSDGGREQGDEKVIHLDEAEHIPRASAFASHAATGEGRSHDLPSAPNSSQAAEVVKQIIEQILINERRRARIEFVQISVFFLIFLFVILGAGIWFARQLLGQLRAERQITEQTWRMMAGQNDGSFSPKSIPPALNQEEVSKLEQDVNALSELLKTGPQNANTSIRDMLQNQQNAIQALSVKLNEAQAKQDAAPEGDKDKPVDFIAAPFAKGLNLRMPIPSL